NPATNASSFIFVGDSATVTGTGNQPLLSLNQSSVDTAGSLLTLRRSNSTATPSMISLTGSLLSATNSSFDTTSLGFGSTNCCHAFLVGQGARLSSSGVDALIQLTTSTFNA